MTEASDIIAVRNPGLSQPPAVPAPPEPPQYLRSFRALASRQGIEERARQIPRSGRLVVDIDVRLSECPSRGRPHA